MCAISATITINTLFDNDWICVEVCAVPRNGEAVTHADHYTFTIPTPLGGSVLEQLLEDLEECHSALYEQQSRSY
jgi:hypothetical protein